LYSNDFEATDDCTLWTCQDPKVWNLQDAQAQGFLTLHEKGLSDQEWRSGGRSLKLDLTLQDKGPLFRLCAWRGPTVKIPLDRPIYVSGYLYAPDLPEGVSVALGWSHRGTSARGEFT